MSDTIDYVAETVKAFITDALTEPTDPVKAIEQYFERNAREELKAKAAAEGKTAAKCWKFIEAVARKALKGNSGHIEPTVVYAIAMHYFEDVPAAWNNAPAAGKPAPAAVEQNPAAGNDSQAAGEPSPAAGKRKTAAKKKARKSGKSQGFFFDLMETETVGGADETH